VSSQASWSHGRDFPLGANSHLSAMMLVGWILATWIVASPSYAADVIYKYVDEQGVTHYTDKPSLIPEKYCSQAQPFDPAKAPVTITAIPSAPPPTKGQPEAPPFYASWLDQFSNYALEQFSKLPIPQPFPYQLAVGLVVVIVAMIILLRLTMPPMLKVLFATALVVLLIVGVYWMNSEGNTRGQIRLSGGCTTPGTLR
jgi:hypothetical protein